MGGITLAWLIGIGIISWRAVTTHHRPPIPGELAGASGFFVLCAVLAEYQPARGAATLLAFGIDIAAYLQAPVITPGRTAAAPAGTASKPAAAASQARVSGTLSGLTPAPKGA